MSGTSGEESGFWTSSLKRDETGETTPGYWTIVRKSSPRRKGGGSSVPPYLQGIKEVLLGVGGISGLKEYKGPSSLHTVDSCVDRPSSVPGLT